MARRVKISKLAEAQFKECTPEERKAITARVRTLVDQEFPEEAADVFWFRGFEPHERYTHACATKGFLFVVRKDVLKLRVIVDRPRLGLADLGR